MRDSNGTGAPNNPAPHLLFRVGAAAFAIPEAAVDSILPNPPLLAIPASFHALTGIIPHSPHPRYALDLRLKFSLTPSGTPPTAIALRDLPIALLVDAVLDSALFSPRQLRPVRPILRHPYRQYTSAVWRGRSRPCFLLDLDKLLAGCPRSPITQPLATDPSARHSAPPIP